MIHATGSTRLVMIERHAAGIAQISGDVVNVFVMPVALDDD